MKTKEQLELKTAERDLAEKQALKVLAKTYDKLETAIRNREYLRTSYGSYGWYVDESDIVSVMSYLKGACDILLGD